MKLRTDCNEIIGCLSHGLSGEERAACEYLDQSEGDFGFFLCFGTEFGLSWSGKPNLAFQKRQVVKSAPYL
jgi:hypothetical protein